MKTTYLLPALAVLAITSADAQEVFYHCMKDGKKLVADRPCHELGAREQKRVDPADLTPLSTSQSLTPSERARSQALDQRLRNEDQHYQARRQAAVQQADSKKQECDSLHEVKASIVAQQRAWSSDYLNQRHREVNDKIYRLGC